MVDELVVVRAGTGTVRQYLDIADHLVDCWGTEMDPGRRPLGTTVDDLDDAISILGLATHTYSLAPVAVELLRRKSGWAVTPIVRLMFECGITAQWVRHVPDSHVAFVNEAARQKTNFAKAVAATLLDIAGDAASAAMKTYPEAYTSSSGGARSFERRCRDLQPGGREYYAVYRLLCTVSHASPGLVEQYFLANESGPGRVPTFNPRPEPETLLLLAHLAASSLVWAGRAAGMVVKRDRLRSEFRQAARELGIESELRLSDDAWLRTRPPKGHG